MITIKQTEGQWAWVVPGKLVKNHLGEWKMIIPKEWTICDDAGAQRPVALDNVVFDRGKYEGQLASEVDDEWYWGFLEKKAHEDGNQWLQYVVSLRDKE